MELTPLLHIIRDIKNLPSCGGAYGRQFEDNYTNNWNLYQI